VAAYNYYWNHDTQRLLRGSDIILKNRLNVSFRQIHRIVKAYNDQIKEDIAVPDLTPKNKLNCEPHSSLTDELRECILVFNSTTGFWRPIRNFTEVFNSTYGRDISITTMHRYTKSMGSVLRNSFVKPLLNDDHKIRRLQFVLDRLEPTTEGNYRIKDMKNVVHVDEKWFYVTREKRKIQKVMFFAAVGVPQKKPDGIMFDGRICIWPVQEPITALRSSVLRSAGTKVTESVPLTAEMCLHLMTKKNGVIDAIREKIPWLSESGVVIQHDGAPPHGGKDNVFHLACAGYEHGYKLEFISQPAHSPDQNKLDLCLFHKMDSEAHVLKGDAPNKEALINAVLQQFDVYNPQKLLRSEALLYEVYRCILKHGGSN
jgi:hypothetical protein